MNETFKTENLWLNPISYFCAILLFNHQEEEGRKMEKFYLFRYRSFPPAPQLSWY